LRNRFNRHDSKTYVTSFGCYLIRKTSQVSFRELSRATFRREISRFCFTNLKSRCAAHYFANDAVDPIHSFYTLEEPVLYNAEWFTLLHSRELGDVCTGSWG
jgi:hypothetical protein